MPALDSGAARDTVADVDPKPRHVDAPDDLFLVLVLDPLGRSSPRDTSGGRPPTSSRASTSLSSLRTGPSGAASARTCGPPFRPGR